MAVTPVLRHGGTPYDCETQVALSVPDRERLDSELIVLDASRATQLGRHVKLRRGDRILRVEEAMTAVGAWGVHSDLGKEFPVSFL